MDDAAAAASSIGLAGVGVGGGDGGHSIRGHLDGGHSSLPQLQTLHHSGQAEEAVAWAAGGGGEGAGLPRKTSLMSVLPVGGEGEDELADAAGATQPVQSVLSSCDVYTGIEDRVGEMVDV